jgi:hypothetical protein
VAIELKTLLPTLAVSIPKRRQATNREKICTSE